MQDNSFYDYLVIHSREDGVGDRAEGGLWWQTVGCSSPDLMERSKRGGGGTREERKGRVGGGAGLSHVNE